MSNILKAMATARESAFFKQEQEADLQRYCTRLISMGQIENTAGANLKPRRHTTFEESVKAFEVLPEVLQQQARLDDPGAAARREIIRRIRGMPTKLSEAEMLKYRSTIYGVAAHVGHVPKMHLGTQLMAYCQDFNMLSSGMYMCSKIAGTCWFVGTLVIQPIRR
ncbi:hypothetical protein ABBQ38_002499 [Trebouxia sp. C0009 RCD-2024]